MTGYGELKIVAAKGRQMKEFWYTKDQARLSLRFHRMLNGKPVKDLDAVRSMIGAKHRPLVVDGVEFGAFRLCLVTVDWVYPDENGEPVLTDVSLHLES